MKKNMWQKLTAIFMILLLVIPMSPVTGQALLETSDDGIAGFTSVVATAESGDDGIVDTLTVTFDDDVIDSSISLADFDVDNATVTNFSTGATENDNIIILTVTPDEGYETAPLGTLTIATGQTIEFENGGVIDSEALAVEIKDEVGPLLLSAEIGTIINGKTDITGIGGHTIQLEMIFPTFAGARGKFPTFGNTSDWRYQDSGNGGLTISRETLSSRESRFIIDAGGETDITLQRVHDLINSDPEASLYLEATFPEGSNPLDTMPSEDMSGSFADYPGSTEVILTFSEDVTLASQGIQFRLYSGTTFSTDGTFVNNGTSTITYNLNTSSQPITIFTSASAKVSTVDAAGNRADDSKRITLTSKKN